MLFNFLLILINNITNNKKIGILYLGIVFFIFTFSFVTEASCLGDIGNGGNGDPNAD
jgi:hypothetical protein